MKNKILRKAAGIILPIMLIWLSVPQTVQAAGISAVNNGDLSITVSVDLNGYDGYNVWYVTEAEYMRFFSIPPSTDGTVCLTSNAIVIATNSTTAVRYTDLGSGAKPFAEGDVVYAVIYLVRYEVLGSAGLQYVVYGFETTPITIESFPQPVTITSHPGTPHTHTYQWVTVAEASLNLDGVEQYACSCGNVQLTQPISAATVYIKGLYGAIKDAAKDGTVDYNAGKWTGINDYVIGKLAERTDVATTITFEYKGASYTFTIPAGTSYESLMSDKEDYYGFFTFCQLLGIPVSQL